MSASAEPTITLTRRDDYWMAIHRPTGVGAQGDIRDEALEELDAAVALHTNEATEPRINEDEVLKDLGIDPDEMPDSIEEPDDGARCR